MNRKIKDQSPKSQMRQSERRKYVRKDFSMQYASHAGSEGVEEEMPSDAEDARRDQRIGFYELANCFEEGEDFNAREARNDLEDKEMLPRREEGSGASEDYAGENDAQPSASKTASEIKTVLQSNNRYLEKRRSATRYFEKNYIDFELNELQQKHERFVERREVTGPREADAASLKSKCPSNSSGLRAEHICSRGDFSKQAAGDGFNNRPVASCSSQDLQNIYNVLNTMLGRSQQLMGYKSHCLRTHIADMQDPDLLVEKLHAEQQSFQKIIKEQERFLSEYQDRCGQAQNVIQMQQLEIEKLHLKNQELESQIVTSIEKLRLQVQSNIADTANERAKLISSSERDKYKRIAHENTILSERLRKLQKDLTDLKNKLQTQDRRKTQTLHKLKATQRDLKVYRCYNDSLKSEKHYLLEELKKTKSQLSEAQANSKRALTRQTEALERQRRNLQKRVQELESKMSRSQSLASTVIQERDRTISELRTQLNSMAYNFQLSQKHVRLLRASAVRR